MIEFAVCAGILLLLCGLVAMNPLAMGLGLCLLLAAGLGKMHNDTERWKAELKAGTCCSGIITNRGRS